MGALESAGLTQNESKLYKLLLRLSKANTTELAKKSGVHRRSVYDVLMRLADKGLVSYMIEENVKVYFANNPSKLSELIDEKKKEVDKGMPELVKTFNENSKKKSTQFFVGKEGIRSILEDQLNEKEVLVLGGSVKANEILKHYMPKYELLRKENKVKMKIIYSGEKLDVPLAEVKQMKNAGEVAFNIYGDNVALLMWNEVEPFAILIRDEDVAGSFKSYFTYIWNTL